MTSARMSFTRSFFVSTMRKSSLRAMSSPTKSVARACDPGSRR
jgi:hypothetical protein